MLFNQEITALIRDTEPHERALFSLDPTVTNNINSDSKSAISAAQSRRKTLAQAQQKQSSAVARVLGNDMLRQIQRSSRDSGRSRGVDVEVLLQGAERLSSVYAVAGLQDRIATLRSRLAQATESITYYEDHVAKQQAKLNRMNSGADFDEYSDPEEPENTVNFTTTTMVSEEDMKAEEEAIKELEAKKKALEARVAGIEKDLGGLRG